MTAAIDAITVEHALIRRLAAVYPILTGETVDRSDRCADLLADLVDALVANPSSDRVWLLLTAIWAAYPPAADVFEAGRILRLRSPVDALLHLLDSRMSDDSPSAADHDVQVVTDRVLVDVDRTATDPDLSPTGEIVLNTLAAWDPAHPIGLAAWSPGWRGWRPLTPAERTRMSRNASGPNADDLEGGGAAVCLVPWRTVVLLPEVPRLEVCTRLAALAELSGNRVVVVGHDFAPVLEAQSMPPSEPSRFAHYLSVVKHSETVAASSRRAGQGFAGFAAALAAQGLSGPAVTSCFFPTQASEDRSPARKGLGPPTPPTRPVVASLGMLGAPSDLPRVMFAAEALWSEGLSFELRLLEGSANDAASGRTIIRLHRAGHPIRVEDSTDHWEAAETLRSASFAIFVPRFEGYSPALAASLSNGTPVIATRGAYADEQASRGGVLTIDRDDDSLVAGMRLLLTNGERLTELTLQAAARSERTWGAFARDLWSIATRAPAAQPGPPNRNTDPLEPPGQHHRSATDGLAGRVPHDAAALRPTGRRRAHTLLEQRATEGPPQRGNLLDRRIRSYLGAVGEIRVPPGLGAAIEVLDASLANASHSRAWLALSVLAAEVARSADVTRLARAARLGTALSELDQILEEGGLWTAPLWQDVEVLVDAVVVDIDHTARNLFATGIQRVTREVAKRWHRDHDVVLAGWTDGYRAFRRLLPAEQAAALRPDRPEAPKADAAMTETRSTGVDHPVLLPWRCKVLIPELPIEGDRPRRYASFARFSESTIGVVGHDCVPLTAAETCDESVDYGFSLWLGALAEMDRVATVSASSGVEYEGWKAMRSAPPPARPDVAAIRLGTEPAEPSERDLDAARQLFATDDVPVVLAVGSHEPRKNHLALLNAAELVWREGVAFALVFIGGNSWHSQDFERAVNRARTQGRPVHLVHRIEDGLLWAAYRLAYCTVFPSLQEGFGLPVAESLACGTPVITADYGSMREQSAGGGVLLVNPRDDRELAAALRRILLDGDLRDKMAAQAAAAPRRSWDDYARETWAYLVDGIGPERSNGR